MNESFLEQIEIMLSYPQYLSDGEYIRLRELQIKNQLHSDKRWIKDETTVIAELFNEFISQHPDVKNDMAEEGIASHAEGEWATETGDLELFEKHVTEERISNAATRKMLKEILDKDYILEIDSFAAKIVAISELVHGDEFIVDLANKVWNKNLRNECLSSEERDAAVQIITQNLVEEAAGILLLPPHEDEVKEEPLFIDGQSTLLDDRTKSYLLNYSQDFRVLISIFSSFPKSIQDKIPALLSFYEFAANSQVMAASADTLVAKGLTPTYLFTGPDNGGFN
ncbi:hypothetical protein KAI87_01905 [Myxococcota bacterium]|nr:hypothetical protein [Myxococcota bacterium]